VNIVRLAATVILAREGESGLEIYMTRRSARSAFAPDAFVFPGGTVDEQDRSPEAHARTLGLESTRLQHAFRAVVPPALPSNEPPISSHDAAALCVAALRELFEEAGVLIARTAGERPVGARDVRDDAVLADRVRVRDGQLSFAEFLERRDWFADARELAYFSHWITPPAETRRYNTHFFFARGPHEQTGVADAHETHDGVWIAPADALARHARREFHLVYPTIKHLERLAAFDRVDAALAFAHGKPVFTIVPTTSPDDGFQMPAELERAW
jgi:8-oxo-dGTP pyrophosphatase MutT (NUDIX family)